MIFSMSIKFARSKFAVFIFRGSLSSRIFKNREYREKENKVSPASFPGSLVLPPPGASEERVSPGSLGTKKGLHKIYCFEREFW